MKNILKNVLLLIISTILLSGCHEVKREYVINPDLSGMVILYKKTSLDPFAQFGATSSLSVDEKAKRAVKAIMENTTGVDTWKDVTWKINDEGKVEFRGKAYFKDFSKLDLDTTTKSSNSFILTKENEKISLKWENREKEKSEVKKTFPKLTDKELEQKIRVEKDKFKSSFAMLSTILTGFKEEDRFTLPGKKLSVKGFKSEGDKIGVSIVGDEILSAMKKLSEDESFWRKSVTNESDLMSKPPEDLQIQIFGALPPFEALFSGGEILFDYEAETAAAKAAYKALIDSLGISLKPTETAAKLAGESSFKSVKLGGASYVFESDPDRGLMPNSQNRGLTLYLIGEWGGAVDNIEEATVSEAITDSGENLIPDESGMSFVSSPQLSTDKSGVLFPIFLKLPQQGAKFIKKLSGRVVYKISSGVKNFDTLLLPLKAGSKSRDGALEISRAAKNEASSQSGYTVAIRINIDPNLLINVKFYDEKSEPLEYYGSGSSCINNECEQEYSFSGEMPTKIGVVIKSHGSMEIFSTPFTIQNIPLMGR